MELRPSIFDRLTDENPGVTRESYVSPWEQERKLHASLCRDLTDLLNTRRGTNDFDPQFTGVIASICNFGIPDFTAYILTSPNDQDRLQRAIEQCIRQFEPRLDDPVVRLVPVDPANALSPVLEFTIDATLKIEPYEQIRFTAALRRESRLFDVSGENE